MITSEPLYIYINHTHARKTFTASKIRSDQSACDRGRVRQRKEILSLIFPLGEQALGCGAAVEVEGDELLLCDT